MIDYKQNVAARVPVSLNGISGTPMAGVTYASVTATVKKADGTQVDASPASGAFWIEATTGAFSGAGEYDLIIPAGLMDQTGPLVYAVKVNGALLYKGLIKVVEREEAETYDEVASLSIDTSTAATKATEAAALAAEVAGLTHKNSVIDQMVFNDRGLLTSSRVRVFPTAADADAGTNVQYTYLMTTTPKAAPDDDKPASFKMTLVP